MDLKKMADQMVDTAAEKGFKAKVVEDRGRYSITFLGSNNETAITAQMATRPEPGHGNFALTRKVEGPGVKTNHTVAWYTSSAESMMVTFNNYVNAQFKQEKAIQNSNAKFNALNLARQALEFISRKKDSKLSVHQ